MQLVEPGPQWEAALLEMAREYAEAGEDRYARALDDFPGFLRKLEQEREREGLAPGRVPGMQFWLEDAGVLLGRASLRLELNAALEEVGGHIGYDVRPSRRRTGVGTELLRLTLIEARKRGLSRTLITCDADNLGSVQVIKRNGGVFAGERTWQGKLAWRFWVEL